jgi:uncharacterized protein YaiL (DUF2058 family)
MGNPFQDQLLKAGLVSKKQVHKAKQEKKKEDQARHKAITAEINQLIIDNCIPRDENCDIDYNFEHNKKIKRVLVNAELKQQIVKGKLGIARIEGRYELVTKTVAEKIQQRNAKRVVIYDAEQDSVDENDPYADYEIPDDLTW